MVITVYGPGCARCYETERVVRNVLAELQHDADLQKVTDYKAMTAIMKASTVPSAAPLPSSASTIGIIPAAFAYIGIPISTASGTDHHAPRPMNEAMKFSGT